METIKCEDSIFLIYDYMRDQSRLPLLSTQLDFNSIFYNFLDLNERNRLEISGIIFESSYLLDFASDRYSLQRGKES